jgi:hypothetical protein
MKMKRFQSILCAASLTLAISATSFAGDIHGRQIASSGDIHGRLIVSSGDIHGRAGDIHGAPAGDDLVDIVVDGILLAVGMVI